MAPSLERLFNRGFAGVSKRQCGQVDIPRKAPGLEALNLWAGRRFFSTPRLSARIFEHFERAAAPTPHAHTFLRV